MSVAGMACARRASGKALMRALGLGVAFRVLALAGLVVWLGGRGRAVQGAGAVPYILMVVGLLLAEHRHVRG